MGIQTEDANKDTLIIYINGEIADKEVDNLRRVMTSREQKNMIVQLSEVSSVSSLAIAMLVMGVKQCDGRKGSFILCQPSNNFQKILEEIGLSDIFILMDTEAEALQYLKDKEID